ncbi:hypothetical protein J6590_095854 [Homalodisca vitripennis]|nr:hypothetical protein J6590_095854 [Homalodisca vitripennis]
MKKERSDGMGDQKGSLPPLTIQTTRLPPGELVDELPNTTHHKSSSRIYDLLADHSSKVVMYREVKWWQQFKQIVSQSACLAIYIPTCSETVRRFCENIKNVVVMYREVKWWQQCETNSLSISLRSDLYPDLLGNCASFLRKDKKRSSHVSSVKQIVSQSACLAIYIPTCSETVRRFCEKIKNVVVMYREVKWWQQWKQIVSQSACVAIYIPTCSETVRRFCEKIKNEVVMYREVKWWQQCETNSLSVGLRSDLYPDLLGNCASFLRKDKKRSSHVSSVKQIVSQSACVAIYIPTCSETVRRFCEKTKKRSSGVSSVKQIVSQSACVAIYIPTCSGTVFFVKIDQSNQKRSSSPSYVQHLNSDADSKFQESSLRQQDLQDIHDADEE